MKYDFAKIESKWQKKWADADLFAAKDNSDKPKFYGLVEFPYPSGAGMHVGHIKAYLLQIPENERLQCASSDGIRFIWSSCRELRHQD